MTFLKQYLVLALLLFTIISCRREEVDGIKIGGTALYDNSSFEENKELCLLVEKTISSDEKALTELIHFKCGDAAGCYDLGYVITQIVYKIGESKFSEMAIKLSEKDKNELNGFIEVGLEYFYKNRIFKSEFKQLYSILNPKSKI